MKKTTPDAEFANKAKSKRGNPNWQTGGKSPNPNGRPKDGESWAGVLSAVSNMYPEDLAQMVGMDNDLGRNLRQLPKGVQMKYLVSARVLAALMFEPTAGLWNGLMDRMDGRLPQPLQEVTGAAGSAGGAFHLPADVISPAFLDAYRDISAKRHTEYIFSGGRGSTKSSFVSLVFIYLLKNNPTMHGIALRQVKDTLRDSVYAQLFWAIGELGLSDEFKCTTSPLEIEYIPTGQKIYFRGADDPGKIKSIKPQFGSISILWFEEISQFKGEKSIRNIIQSAIRGTDDAYIFKSYNPPRTASNWINKYVSTLNENQYLHKSDYRSVPVEWIGKFFIDTAKLLEEINPDAYANEYLGEVNGIGDQVFNNIQIREITDEEINEFDNVLHGLDFGYFPHPAHYSRVHYDAARLTLYIFGEVRKWKTSNRDMYDALVAYGLDHNDMLIADSAEPKSVADFRSYGANCRGAEKGNSSVKYSMKWLQSLKAIVIDNKRCPYSAEEFIDFTYEKTKDGDIIDAYPNEKDDAIAATRYATNLIWRSRGQ